ncbi:MAG: MFS transporter [Legionellaceae bacterium]|nr:MFS transporter [Legionellaceae bacterium]
MKSTWLRTVLPIAAIFSCRMLGLFLLIPVFSLYASSLTGATPALIGLALGCYGLSQGLLQIPFGLLSDHYGRKPLIIAGLILLALGSILGATTHSIIGMMIARTMQGMGAIGSVLMALMADLTPESKRTASMAIIGGSIGLSFNLAFIISPPLAQHTGLSGLFMVTVVLACLGLLLIHFVVPKPNKTTPVLNTTPYRMRLSEVFKQTELQRLNLGIFCQHAMLTSTFFVLPLRLNTAMEAHKITALWQFYLPMLVISFLAAVPLIIFAEKRGQTKLVLLVAVGLMGVAQALLAQHALPWVGFCSIMFVYFLAFNALEAMLPSLVSKRTNPNNKGTAMGVYSSSQFIGIFAGGSLAGLLYQHYGNSGVFITNALVAAVWLGVATSMKKKPVAEQPAIN